MEGNVWWCLGDRGGIIKENGKRAFIMEVSSFSQCYMDYV